MSIKALMDFTFISRYAGYNKTSKRRESWSEAVTRVKEMHLQKYPEAADEINWAFEFVYDKKVLGSQRAMQFGGDAMLRHNARGYNCTASYCDRLRFFQEALYLLLCGTGVGFSVQKHHVAKLPEFKPRVNLTQEIYQIPDSIEGWADALGVLLDSYFTDPKEIVLDYSLIRPAGSPLSHGCGKAPGHLPLKNALEKIVGLLNRCLGAGQTRLRPVDAHDLVCHASDAVLSGGIRRSALITLFSYDDEEMLNAKIGNWFIDNPQRARSNNTAVLLRDKITREQFERLIQSTKEFGEPGYLFADHNNILTNPCILAKTKVLTPKGIRILGEVDVGDKIWSQSGWTKIVKKWSTGIKEVFKYTTTAGIFYGTDNHQIVSNGIKVQVGEAESIDILRGRTPNKITLDPQDIMDGLVLGDGTVKGAHINLCVGQDDQDYFTDIDVSKLINVAKLYGKRSYSYNKVTTTITPEELPYTYNRSVPDRFLFGNSNKVCGVLRGLYSANGSMCGSRVTYKTASFNMIEHIQMMLSSVGIKSYFTSNKPSTVKFSNGTYTCKKSYDLNISGKDVITFAKNIGFIQKYKADKLNILTNKIKSRKSRGHVAHEIQSVESLGQEEVFDITVDNKEHTYWSQCCNVSNCCEISMYGYDYLGRSGWQVCNLCEINGKKIKSLDDFKQAAKAGAILGTLQAGYHDFPYLGEVSENIIRREALLGVSITGFMDSPDILLNPDYQDICAKIVLETNKELAKKIGINPTARATTCKPSGTTSCILGTASGIHPHHAKRYFRRVQNNNMDPAFKHFAKINARATEKSVWSANNTDSVITFCVEVPDGAKVKNDLTAIEMLEVVKSTYKHWVSSGKNIDNCVQPWLNHNVSNTINVKPEEWDEVTQYIYDNRNYFAGISLLPISGDKDYTQAPMCTVYTPTEIVKQYGDGSLMASGLIVDGLAAFNDDLWAACNVVLDFKPAANDAQVDWVRRAHQFSIRYFNGDTRNMTYCLKDVHNWKLWCDLKREYKDVDYTQMAEEENNVQFSESAACAGGKCEITI